MQISATLVPPSSPSALEVGGSAIEDTGQGDFRAVLARGLAEVSPLAPDQASAFVPALLAGAYASIPPDATPSLHADVSHAEAGRTDDPATLVALLVDADSARREFAAPVAPGIGQAEDTGPDEATLSTNQQQTTDPAPGALTASTVPVYAAALPVSVPAAAANDVLPAAPASVMPANGPARDALEASPAPGSSRHAAPAPSTDAPRARATTAVERTPAFAAPAPEPAAAGNDLAGRGTEAVPGLAGNHAAAASHTQPASAPRNDVFFSNAPATGRIEPAFGSAAWGSALGREVAWLVNGGQQRAELQLNPIDLGPVEISLKIEHQHAELSFVAREPAVREAIEAALPRLREQLASVGIEMGQAHVGSEQQARDDGRPGDSRKRTDDTTAPTEAPVPAPARSAGGRGLIDTFA